MNVYREVMDSLDIERKNKLPLLGLAFFIDKTGRTDPTLQRLGSYVGVGKRQMRNQLNDLSEAGLISVQRKRNAEGRLTNHYTITLPETEAA